MMDIVERLQETPELTPAQYWEAQASMWHENYKEAADEIERLRSQMDLFDPSTTQEMAAAALNFANDEIKRLQERNHALRKALQNIADGPRDVERSYVSLLHEVQSEARKALGDE